MHEMEKNQASKQTSKQTKQTKAKKQTKPKQQQTKYKQMPSGIFLSSQLL